MFPLSVLDLSPVAVGSTGAQALHNSLDLARHCDALGYTRYNAALGESQELAHVDWQDAEAMARWLTALPIEANSGDVYARLA